MLDLVDGTTTAGFKQFLFAILADDIETWPTKDPASNAYTGDFTLKTGKAWSKMAVSDIPGEVSFVQEAQGNNDNPTTSDTLTAFVRGYDAANSKKLDDAEGKRYVFLLPDADNCGQGTDQYQVAGNACSGLTVRSIYQNDGTKKGFTITANGFNTGKPFAYTGAITV